MKNDVEAFHTRFSRAPLLARALPGRAAAVLGQAAIAAGIIAEGRSPGSRLRKPVEAQQQ